MAIEHVFVLMLENRSFDHMFACAGLPGVPLPPAQFGFSCAATDSLAHDPPHEYADVKAQIANGSMTGFQASGGATAMAGLPPSLTPVVTTLAANFLLMDNWFSSMPGPTWPNRCFVHAASSGGLDNSPSGPDAFDAVGRANASLAFENGHIFDALTAAGRSWRIYRGDWFPQVLALPGMVDVFRYQPLRRLIVDQKDFAKDVAARDAADYTFIEPNYDVLGNFAHGNSQHPLGAISAGERLISYFYAALRNSPLWEKSLLVITWDEHGGFFDHVPPPAATPPGDKPINYKRAKHPQDCAFDRLGVRVPTLLVSPLLPKGLGSVVFPGQSFDHASVVASVRRHFGIATPLTRRDATAPIWNNAVLAKPRTDVPGLAPKTALTAPAKATSAFNAKAVKGPPAENLGGFLQIARALDFHDAKLSASPPLFAAAAHKKPLAQAGALMAAPAKVEKDTLAAHKSMLKYLAAVAAREEAHQQAAPRKPARKSTVAKKKPK